jgi:hypothetical protein
LCYSEVSGLERRSCIRLVYVGATSAPTSAAQSAAFTRLYVTMPTLPTFSRPHGAWRIVLRVWGGKYVGDVGNDA